MNLTIILNTQKIIRDEFAHHRCLHNSFDIVKFHQHEDVM